MKFGVFLMPQHPRSDDPVQRFRETLMLARAARDAGFDAVAAGHHYLSPPYQSLQSIPLLSRLAAETGSMDLVLSVLLLPLLNPVQVAEDVASLDVMSEGRCVFGIGLGYREVEFEGRGESSQGVNTNTQGNRGANNSIGGEQRTGGSLNADQSSRGESFGNH